MHKQMAGACTARLAPCTVANSTIHPMNTCGIGMQMVRAMEEGYFAGGQNLGVTLKHTNDHDGGQLHRLWQRCSVTVFSIAASSVSGSNNVIGSRRSVVWSMAST